MTNLDKFTAAYLECALWASTDNSDESGGDPLDANYSIAEIAPEEIADAIEACADFKAQAGDLLIEWTDEQAGHDFWLTRNRHGAGFWDRGRAAGKALTDLAHSFGSADPYVGDDGQLYGFS